MQEFEYRAWNKEKNIMVYKNEDSSAAYWDGVFSSVIELINSSLKYRSGYEFMQYIGIKDIHQKKVFQGDIVKVKQIIYTDCSREEIEEIREFVGEVVWWQFAWNIAIKSRNGISYKTLWLWDIHGEGDDTMEIIGDRYNNPEMKVIE